MVYESLRAGVQAYEEARGGPGTPVAREWIESAVRERVAKEPLVSSIDYISIASRGTMKVTRGGGGRGRGEGEGVGEGRGRG